MSNICNQCRHLSRSMNGLYFRSVISKSRNFGPLISVTRDYHVGDRQFNPIHQKLPGILSGKWTLQKQLIRSAFRLPNPFRRHQDFRAIDRVPSTYTCVYVSPIGLYITYFYPIATISSVFILAAVLNQLLLGDPGSALGMAGLKASYTSTFNDTQLMIGSAVTSAMGLSVWRLSARTPLRIYFDQDEEKFIATFATNRPWRTKKVHFEPGDVVHKFPTDPESNTITLGTFLGEYMLKERRVGLVADSFIQPYYYNTMLGIIDSGIDKQND